MVAATTISDDAVRVNCWAGANDKHRRAYAGCASGYAAMSAQVPVPLALRVLRAASYPAVPRLAEAYAVHGSLTLKLLCSQPNSQR